MSLTRRELKKHRAEVVQTTWNFSDATLLVNIASIGRYWRFAAACTITVPDDRTIPVDSEIRGRQGSAGEITFIPIDGVVINGVDGYNNALNLEGSVFKLKKVGTMEWDLEGIPSLSVSGGADVTPPTILSSAAVSVYENSTLLHTLSADEAVVWSIIGGADFAQFEISGATLRWVSNGTQDYEAPTDAGGDNDYVVQIRATDLAANTTDQTITISVLNVIETFEGTLLLTPSAPAMEFSLSMAGSAGTLTLTPAIPVINASLAAGAGTLTLTGGGGNVPEILVLGNPTFTTTNKNAGITLSTGDTEADWTSGSGRRNVFSTKVDLGGSNKKMVMAMRLDAKTTATEIRVGPVNTSLGNGSNFAGVGTQPLVYDLVSGNLVRNGGTVTNVGAASNGDIIMIGVYTATIASDATVIFGKNGVWFTDPATIVSALPHVNMTSNYALASASANTTGVGVTLIQWPYAVPAGFSAPGDT